MNKFFLDLLNNLHNLHGLRQVETIYATSDDPKKTIDDLIDTLTDVCKNFSFIPDGEKKKILHKAVITDAKMTSLNAAFVYQHLAANADRYFMQEHHQPEKKPQPEPLTGEARQERLRQWKAEVEKMANAVTPDYNRISTALREHLPGGKEPTPPHRSTTPEEHAARELHNLWIRENFDKYGNKLSNYQDESVWLKNRTQK